MVFIFVGNLKHTQAVTIAQTMPKAFWAFHTVLIHSKWFVRFVKEMWLKRSANAKLESWCMWAGKVVQRAVVKKEKEWKLKRKGWREGGTWGNPSGVVSGIWNCAFFPLADFFLLSLSCSFFHISFSPWLIYFMPRGLFVFPGLFVVHLDLGTLINQFLWRLWSKNEHWVGFWANLNWYTSDEVKFSHVKFHCY